MLARIGHHIDKRNMRDIAEKGLRAIARMNNLHAKAQEQMGEMVAALEVNASAFFFGFARGYWAQPGQDVAIMGIPVDLAGGLLGHAFALFGGLGRYKADAHNFSNGALASYSTTLGLKMGVEQAQKHPPSAAAHGYSGYYTGGGLPPQDDSTLAGIVANATR
jgi:hypothetical protein